MGLPHISLDRSVRALHWHHVDSSSSMSVTYILLLHIIEEQRVNIYWILTISNKRKIIWCKFILWQHSSHRRHTKLYKHDFSCFSTPIEWHNICFKYLQYEGNCHWGVKQYGLVDMHQCFRETCSHYLQHSVGHRWQVLPKDWYLSLKLHGITT
jgi:hypothetical protein